MATHSSVLAWRIPWTAEPGGLSSMGSHRVRHNWSDLAAAAYYNIKRIMTKLKKKKKEQCLFIRAFSLLLSSDPVVPTSLWPHGLQHGRPACPLPSPRVWRISCSLHWWCHPAISSSNVLFSFCPWSFPATGTFPMSHLFASGKKYWNFNFSISPFSDIQGWSPLRLTGLISLLSKGLSGVFSNTTVQRHQFFSALPSFQSSSHNHTWPLGRP